MKTIIKLLLLSVALVASDSFISVKAQSTNNQSSLTNQAAPSASSVTTGGTNINYQTNNTYQNEVGFGPGIFCRTPTIFVGGNVGGNDLNVSDALGASTNNANNYQVNAGIVMPFGSRAIETCKNFVGESIPVINKERNTLVGIITESDLFTAYLELNRQIRDLEAGLRS